MIYQFRFEVARKGYAEGPGERKITLEAANVQDAYAAFQQECGKEYPDAEWDIWNVSHSEHKVKGRPKERSGEYERITLEIRKDLLAKMDASGKSRREYIEELIAHDGAIIV